ncbi:MAG: hypothetical protein PVG45_09165 [Gammaproteobacteria bacterium]
MTAYRDEVQGFAARGNYHAAINVALSGMNQCRKAQDQQGVDQCLQIIEGLITRLVQEFGSKDYLEKQ